jgi:hypothetical protein
MTVLPTTAVARTLSEVMLILVSPQREFLPAPGKNSRPERHQSGMSRRRSECTRAGGAVDVTAWRRCRLLDAGFPPALADRLAAGRLDLHELLQLVDRGCPPELAARILEPVDGVP